MLLLSCFFSVFARATIVFGSIALETTLQSQSAAQPLKSQTLQYSLVVFGAEQTHRCFFAYMNGWDRQRMCCVRRWKEQIVNPKSLPWQVCHWAVRGTRKRGQPIEFSIDNYWERKRWGSATYSNEKSALDRIRWQSLIQIQILVAES